jgi:hypothetical protein
MAERDDVKDTRSAEQIRRDIAAKRETITSTVDTLGERIQEKLDWRGYIARYPYASMGAAAGIGFMAGYMMRRKRSPFERVVDAITDSIEDAGDQVRSAIGSALTRAGGRGLVKGTVYGVAGRLAMNWLKRSASQAFHSDAYYTPTAAQGAAGSTWSAQDASHPAESSTTPV